MVAAGSTAAVVCGLWSFCGRLSHLLFEVHTQDDEFWIEKDTKIASASGSRSVRGGGRPIHPPWGGVGGVCVCARALALTCTAYCYSKMPCRLKLSLKPKPPKVGQSPSINHGEWHQREQQRKGQEGWQRSRAERAAAFSLCISLSFIYTAPRPRFRRSRRGERPESQGKLVVTRVLLSPATDTEEARSGTLRL